MLEDGTVEYNCEKVEFGSSRYGETVALREKVLRAPLGMKFSSEELYAEKDSYHLAAYHGGRLMGCLVLNPEDDATIRMRQLAVAKTDVPW